ncbi:hypothetical protein C2845_PM10G11590 [Panicum miliaceum]|uniref:Uncharacterized protein n=1 Tax=Panicum miliaceum TaxID=4540 RepID=A0A3L6PDY1_PANMI|nr:hypothetical protein C2845_PM10G11590 [Panicum miliaceum]
MGARVVSLERAHDPMVYEASLFQLSSTGAATDPVDQAFPSEVTPALGEDGPTLDDGLDVVQPGPGDPPTALTSPVRELGLHEAELTKEVLGHCCSAASPLPTTPPAPPGHVTDRDAPALDAPVSAQELQTPTGPASYLLAGDGSNLPAPDAAEDAANCPALQLIAFENEVKMAIQPPLAQRPPKAKRPAPPQAMLPTLPKRSERLANHPLANVASSKRAEVVLMRRFKVLPEDTAANNESKQAYTQLYSEKLDGDHFEAVRELLPALRNASPALGLTA